MPVTSLTFENFANPHRAAYVFHVNRKIKNLLYPLKTSTGFTCNGDCVLCELKTNIFIYYLVECGTNPLASRIKLLSSLIIFSFIHPSSHISSVYPLQAAKKEEILL